MGRRLSRDPRKEQERNWPEMGERQWGTEGAPRVTMRRKPLLTGRLTRARGPFPGDVRWQHKARHCLCVCWGALSEEQLGADEVRGCDRGSTAGAGLA